MFTHYEKKNKNKWKGKGKRLSVTTEIAFKGSCCMSGKAIHIRERLMQSAPALSGGLESGEDVSDHVGFFLKLASL